MKELAAKRSHKRKKVLGSHGAAGNIYGNRDMAASPPPKETHAARANSLSMYASKAHTTSLDLPLLLAL